MRPIKLALPIALLIALPSFARGAEGPVAEFAAAWATIDNYTATIAVHETAGNAVQDRVYHYEYKKPHFARIEITGGAGRGSGAVWSGGDRVKGHQGGFLISSIKLAVSIDDGRATSLRGDRIDRGSFQSVADDLTGARVEPGPGSATIGGVLCDNVTIVPAAPQRDVTRRVVCFARTTHLPLRRTSYAGDTPVKQEDFSDVRLNPGLKESDFG